MSLEALRLREDLILLRMYELAFPKSHELFDRADKVFLNGITHVGRTFSPFPIYVTRAKGSRKWDVDGNEYVDYWGGHGALILGHGRPEVVEAVQKQISKGLHLAEAVEAEVEWAEMVNQLIPSAEMVRFTSSGTEATLLAIRLARAYSGKSKIISLRHFHGWHDNVIAPDNPAGVIKGVKDSVIVCQMNIEEVEAAMKNDHDIACLILYPPSTAGEFLKKLREITKRYEVLLIFDEVVSGFRITPNGVQGLYNVIPDLTALAKILAGGLPGGATVGRKDIMQLLEFRDDTWNRTKKVSQPGTFQAHPLSAAAGTVCLKLVATGEENKKADRYTQTLVSALNEVIGKHGVNWKASSDFSHFGIGIGSGADPDITTHFRRAMRLYGVDMSGAGGICSSAHTDEDAEKTAAALDGTLRLLKKEKLVK